MAPGVLGLLRLEKQVGEEWGDFCKCRRRGWAPENMLTAVGAPLRVLG